MVSEENILNNIIAFCCCLYIIFSYYQFFCWWQMLLPIFGVVSNVMTPFFITNCCFCDSCFVTVVMTLFVADVMPLW